MAVLLFVGRLAALAWILTGKFVSLFDKDSNSRYSFYILHPNHYSPKIYGCSCALEYIFLQISDLSARPPLDSS